MRKPMNRRMFLRGAGGAVMAIPFLPSLLSKAFAADPKLGPPPRFFLAFGTYHGDVWGKNMYPNDALLTQKRTTPAAMCATGTCRPRRMKTAMWFGRPCVRPAPR